MFRVTNFLSSNLRQNKDSLIQKPKSSTQKSCETFYVWHDMKKITNSINVGQIYMLRVNKRNKRLTNSTDTRRVWFRMSKTFGFKG